LHDSQAKQKDSDDEMSDSDDDEDDDEDGGASGGEAPPVLHARQVAPGCGVNRMRCMPQRPGVVAAWGDNARVQV
jgi:ribosome assembly protein RRB1